MPRAVAAHVDKTGFRPMQVYGSAVTGITPQFMQELRTGAARAHGALGGRSISVRLAAYKDDPALQYYEKVLFYWASTLWSGRVPDAMLKDAWMLAHATVSLAARPSLATVGGTGVLMAVLREIGWASPNFHSLITCDGTVLNMKEICPRTVLRYLDDDFQQRMMDLSSVRKQMLDYDGANGFPRVHQVTYDDGESEHQLTEMEGGLGQEAGDPSRDDPQSSRLLGAAAAPTTTCAASSAAAAEPTPAAGARQQATARAALYRDLLIGTEQVSRERCQRFLGYAGSARGADGGLTPWIAPLATIASSAHAKRSSAVRSTVAMAEGGWWTQWRKYVQGVRDNPRCECGAAVDCLSHRMISCPLARGVRKEFTDQDILKQAAAQDWNPLFHRGVPYRPTMPPDPGKRTVDFGDHDHPRYVTGSVYTDGALRGRCRRVLRAGWAYAMTDHGGQLVWGRCGTMDERYPTVYRSELRAVLEALKLIDGPTTIYTDNAAVVRGFRRGPTWCQHPRRDGADLWRHIWELYRQKTDEVNVKKVKAHLTAEHVHRGEVQWKDLAGNFVADKWAKEGAAMAQRSSPARLVERLFRQAVRWYRWTTFYASRWSAVHGGGEQRDDAEDIEEPPDPEPMPAAAQTERGHDRQLEGGGEVPLHLRPARLHHLSPHELWADHRRTICRRCGRQSTAETAATRNRFTSTRCMGAAAARALLRLGARSTVMDRRGRVERQTLADMGMTPLLAGTQRSSLDSPTLDPPDGDDPASAAAPRGHQGHGAGAELEARGIKRSRSPSAAAARQTRPRLPPEAGRRAHRLQLSGPIAFCDLCGRYAIERHGIGLQEHCTGRDPNVAVRIQRMRRGQHPITGELLTASESHG